MLYLASSNVLHMRPTLKDISEWVVPFVTDRWEKIFIQLLDEKHHHVMTQIRDDYNHCEKACQAMFEQWLIELCPNPSWNDLISALRAKSVRKIALAEQLVERLGLCMVTHTCMHLQYKFNT